MSLNTKIEHFRVVTYNYEIERNGQRIKKEHYNSSHTRSPSTMRKYLEQGYGTELVLQNSF